MLKSPAYSNDQLDNIRVPVVLCAAIHPSSGVLPYPLCGAQVGCLTPFEKTSWELNFLFSNLFYSPLCTLPHGRFHFMPCFQLR